MEITYLGHASFKIKAKDMVIVTDPYDSEEVGLKFPAHVTAQIVTLSHDHFDHSRIKAIEGTPLVLTNPGDYESGGCDVVGFLTYHDAKQGSERGSNTVFKITVEGLTIVHLGDIGHVLSEELIEEIGDVDILMVPVGGTYTVDARGAKEIISQIEPKITIPMHYQVPELVDSLKNNLAPLSQFLKEIGKEGVEPQDKLVVKVGSLPEEPQIVVLK